MLSLLNSRHQLWTEHVVVNGVSRAQDHVAVRVPLVRSWVALPESHYQLLLFRTISRSHTHTVEALCRGSLNFSHFFYCVRGIVNDFCFILLKFHYTAGRLHIECSHTALPLVFDGKVALRLTETKKTQTHRRDLRTYTNELQRFSCWSRTFQRGESYVIWDLTEGWEVYWEDD